MSAILFSGLIGPVPVSVIIREQHESSIGITELPIETGAKITDHAYIEPKRITLEFGDAFAAATYNALVRFQESRIPFTFVSGLYVYTNMLIKRLRADRDYQYSRVLNGVCELQEVILVATGTASASTGQDGTTQTSSPGKPGGVKSTNAAPPTVERAGNSVTADRAAGTAMRGDVAQKTVPAAQNKSLLSRVIG